MITSATTLNDLFDIAVSNAENIVVSGEQFIVRDLFTGVEWKRISIANRIKLGSMFLFYVEGKSNGIFAPVSKTPQNQQIYVRN